MKGTSGTGIYVQEVDNKTLGDTIAVSHMTARSGSSTDCKAAGKTYKPLSVQHPGCSIPWALPQTPLSKQKATYKEIQPPT